MNNPFDFFDKIYCINLDYRKDRWAQAQEEFNKINILNRVERISGVVTNRFEDPKRNACFGNHLSHSIAIHNAKQAGANNVLIFEDDVLFINDPPYTIGKIANYFTEMNRGWDMLYLGVNTEQPSYMMNEMLAVLTFAFSTHAYAVNFQNSLVSADLYDINTDENVIHNDVEYNNRIIPNYNCYACLPMLAIQRPSYSDIEEKFMDYSWMEGRFYSNLKGLCGK